MELIDIKASIRTSAGNGPARVLRREGMIPAVLYGPKSEPVMLTVKAKALEEIVQQRNISQVLLNLNIDGDTKGRRAVMLKELQKHPVSRAYLHVDFYEIDMQHKIRVQVPVEIVGKSAGVEMGGMLQLIRRDLEVLCLPLNIPEKIQVDTTALEIGESLHTDDIKFPEGVEIAGESNLTIVTVLGAKAEEAEEEEAAEGEGEGEEEAGEEED